MNSWWRDAKHLSQHLSNRMTDWEQSPSQSQGLDLIISFLKRSRIGGIAMWQVKIENERLMSTRVKEATRIVQSYLTSESPCCTVQ